MKNVLCSWSGGKDCCYALVKAKQMGYNPVLLLNMMDDDMKTSRSHGLPVEALKIQAKNMNIELWTIPTSREQYETNFINALLKAKKEFNIEGIVYGDIDLVEHKVWQERICKIVDMEPIIPLWNIPRTTIAKEIVEIGIESVVVACNEKMGSSYLGKTYSTELINQLKEIKIDSCGEDGEFHSFVVNSPLHKKRVEFQVNSSNLKDGFHFIDWNSANLS